MENTIKWLSNCKRRIPKTQTSTTKTTETSYFLKTLQLKCKERTSRPTTVYTNQFPRIITSRSSLSTKDSESTRYNRHTVVAQQNLIQVIKIKLDIQSIASNPTTNNSMSTMINCKHSSIRSKRDAIFLCFCQHK
jgi:hypothetical protein